MLIDRCHLQGSFEGSLVQYYNNGDRYFIVVQYLHSVGKRRFYSNLMNKVDFYNLNNFNLDTLDENKINHYNNLMKQKNVSYCKNAVIDSKKLEFYNIF